MKKSIENMSIKTLVEVSPDIQGVNTLSTRLYTQNGFIALRRMICLTGLLMIIAGLSLFGRNQPNTYKIIADIKPESSSLKGEVWIRYHNPTGNGLDCIFLRVKN